MLKFGFQYSLYIFAEYSSVLKMPSKCCYGLFCVMVQYKHCGLSITLIRQVLKCSKVGSS